jgi:cell division protein FtsW
VPLKGQLEQRVLVLVTLGLVAFGLVMVFSATSAAAALGEGDPMRFLVKQGAYALVGAVLLTVFARLDYHGFRVLAPSLLLAALALCVLVLAFGPRSASGSAPTWRGGRCPTRSGS